MQANTWSETSEIYPKNQKPIKVFWGYSELPLDALEHIAEQFYTVYGSVYRRIKTDLTTDGATISSSYGVVFGWPGYKEAEGWPGLWSIDLYELPANSKILVVVRILIPIEETIEQVNAFLISRQIILNSNS